MARGRFVAHSCQPNCVFVAERVLRDGEQRMYGSFRAVRDIAKGELLTSSYAADNFAATSREQRRQHLLDRKGFWCRCACCAEDAGSEDPFDGWPCPRCRPRQADGDLPEDQLAGCRALRSSARSPPWRSECGGCFSDEEVIPEGGRALEREALLSVHEPVKTSTAASRNAFLARVLRQLGEGHSATQALLRTVTLRSVASAQALEPMVQHLDRCHEFLVSAGWPLGMMPVHALYRALISRAQAEVKARSPASSAWLKLVGDATAAAVVVEGADSETARTGLVVTKLLATLARGGGGSGHGGGRAGAAK